MFPFISVVTHMTLKYHDYIIFLNESIISLDIFWSNWNQHIFSDRGENRELRVGVRRAMRQHGNVPSSVISSHSMHLGVLATAWHAISTGTMFTVYYKPR